MDQSDCNLNSWPEINGNFWDGSDSILNNGVRSRAYEEEEKELAIHSQTLEQVNYNIALSLFYPQL